MSYLFYRVQRFYFSATWHKYGETSAYVYKKKLLKVIVYLQKLKINVLSKMYACVPNLDSFIFPTE